MGQQLPVELANDVNDFADWMRGMAMADSTVHHRTALLSRLLVEWGGWDVRPSTITRWLGRHHGWTRHTYFLAIRCAYRFALEEGLVAADPTARIPRPPRPAARPRPLPPELMHEALATAYPRTRQYLLLAYLAGLRAHEVAKFRGEDIAADVLHVQGKGGLVATLPTHPLLWELAQQMPHTGWWFPSSMDPSLPVRKGSVSFLVSHHLRKVGVSTGGIHRVRASYGTDLLRGGAHIRVVQELMRHRSLASTELYLGVAADELTQAIRGLAVAA